MYVGDVKALFAPNKQKTKTKNKQNATERKKEVFSTRPPDTDNEQEQQHT
jgi:hypothetical protein